jgi:hypothetical protein
MSHITGTIQTLDAPQVIGPGLTVFNPPPASDGTKLLMLHFQNLNFETDDALQVNLGYDTDSFTAVDGPSFWTRPINVYDFPDGVEITYIAAGPETGSVELDRYGRGERHAGEPGHPSFSNCDPFYETAAYLEPTYDPFWYCDEPPNWESATCVEPASDVRAEVARSVGMIITEHGELGLSTCSVTLVDSDKVISAGHCFTPEQGLSGSVTFDYQTDCDGNRPDDYNPRFFKVKAVLGHQNQGSDLDYSLLQLVEPVPGIPIIQMRHDLPEVGEDVFGVHHPNGAVKKLSLPNDQGFSTVTSSTEASGIFVPSDFHVSGGSSGSGLFDAAGRIVGILSRGDPCGGFPQPLAYSPTKNILADLVPAPPPSITRDVMLVFDRSGSMSLDDGTGRPKMEAARDAVSLFVQLVRADTGNRVGLVSFSTTANSPPDFELADVTGAAKTDLVGPPPFIGGLIGDLEANGMTTIGGGLDVARLEFPDPDTNPRAILLMTDGLQNTDPMIDEVDEDLDGITVHAIGFGSESSLDGELLTELATAHDGMYMRAGGGLELEKFFSSAFGNIFEAGVLFDPEFNLPADQSGDPIEFHVCGEETITAVAGWDRTDTSLLLEVTSPGGAVITGTTVGVERASGRTWTFLRIPLPFGGERDGEWSVRVVRPSGSTEFPPPAPALRYFINVIPTGGPKILRPRDRKRYYTGDHFNPIVMVRYDNGGWPHHTEVEMTITRPDTPAGNVLSQAGLDPPALVDGDAIPSRQATLLAIETSTGNPVVAYTETNIVLSDDSANTRGMFEGHSTYGKEMGELLTVEGNYTFHAKARYGEGCVGMRELKWSIHVNVGIDEDKTTVSSTPLDPGPDGGPCVRITFTPRDKYGNLLGPGRADSFEIEPIPGSTPSGAVVDLGNGSYRVDVCADPDSLDPPGFGIVQPGRPPVVVRPKEFKLFVYSVKFLCGEQKADCCGCSPVQPGRYSTEINIHNTGSKNAPVLKRAIPLVLAGAVSGREPKFKSPATADIIVLGAHTATMDDCCRLAELLFGAMPSGPVPLTIGILEIISTVQLSVTAVYTASDGGGGAPSIDVKQVDGHTLTI